MKKPRLLLLKIHQENMFHLTFPDISHKSRYLDMIEEWKNFEPTPTSPKRLFSWQDYEEFLEITTNDITVSSNEINNIFWFFMNDNTISGAIQIRQHIEHPILKESWWHISYGLRPSVRWKWLSKEMLRLSLIEAKRIWLNEVKLSAFEDNIASWKTIEHCEWIFLKNIITDGKLLKFYKIILT